MNRYSVNKGVITMISKRNSRSLRHAAPILVTGFAALGLALSPGLALAQSPNQASVTFSKDIAPILQRSCQNCHHPGSIAPMSLVTYEDARPWARSIKQRVSLREMPPWFIEKHVGIKKFKDDPSLTDAEIETIVKWVDGGAVRGNPADLPLARQFDDASKWSIGKPDLIFTSPATMVQAVAPDWYPQHGPVDIGLTEDRYVKAIETKPTPESQMVIHHAGVSAVRGAAPDGEIRDAEASIEDGGQLTLYEIGRNAEVFPDNSARLIRAGTKVNFSMHYHSIGKPVEARTEVGIRFYPKGTVPKYLREFVYVGNTWELDLPAGKEVRTDGYFLMPKAARIGTFEPHMHTRGVRQCLEAIHLDGRIETLSCAKYNHNWVKIYTYDEDTAPLLPAGTILHSIGWYDNTTKNPRNFDAQNWAGWGMRTIDDMSITFVNLTWFTEEQYTAEIAARRAQTRVSNP